MVCKYCGKEISSDSKFCASCGAPTAPMQAQPMNYVQNPTPVSPMPMQAQPVGAIPPAVPPMAGGKKKGKAGLVVLIIILVLLLAGGGALAFIFLNRPINKVNNALEAGDMEAAVELYGDLSGDKDREDVSEKLLAYAEEVRDSYLNEETDYDTAMETLNLLAGASLKTDDEVEDIRAFVNRIYASREAFASAEQYRADGDYAMALKEYANVMEEDSRYYDRAQAAIAEVEQELEASMAEAGKELIGTWALDCDLADAMTDELGSDYADFQASLPMTLLFDFNEDGTYKMYIDENAFTDGLNHWLDAFIDYSAEMMYSELEESGMSREDVDEFVEYYYGMGVEEYLRYSIELEINISDLVGDMVSTGKYQTEYNKLYLIEDYSVFNENVYDIFSVNGDKLKIELPEGADESEAEIVPGLSYPLEFYRR